MNKALKIISTVLIVIGLGYVFFYITSTNATGIEVLQKPSYYVQQNFWFVFLAGAAVLVFSILSSFFVWHKDAEPQEEVLLNAGFAGKKQIASWLEGSTLDVGRNAANVEEVVEITDDAKTEILQEEKTEIIEAATEILEEGKTLILPENETEEAKTEIITEEDPT